MRFSKYQTDLYRVNITHQIYEILKKQIFESYKWYEIDICEELTFLMYNLLFYK